MTVSSQHREQKKYTREQENWISVDKVKAKCDDHLSKGKAILSQKMVGGTKTLLFVALLGGVSGLAPRQSLDMSLLKVRNNGKNKDNYCKSGNMYFRRCKILQKYGLQVLGVPSELSNTFKKWTKMSNSDYMFFSSSKSPLTISQISRVLSKVLDDSKVSVDVLRHTYLTDLCRGVPSLVSMEKTAKEVGHSVQTALTYVKRD